MCVGGQRLRFSPIHTSSFRPTPGGRLRFHDTATKDTDYNLQRPLPSQQVAKLLPLRSGTVATRTNALIQPLRLDLISGSFDIGHYCVTAFLAGAQMKLGGCVS